MDEAVHKTLQDPLIQQTARELDKSIPQEHRQDYERVVLAGMKLLFSKRTIRFIEDGAKFTKGPDQGCAELVRMTITMLDKLREAADGRLNMSIAWQATYMLSLHGLDFYDRKKVIVIDGPFLGRFTQKLSGAFLRYFNISKEQVSGAIKAGREDIMSKSDNSALAGQGVANV